MIEFIYKIGTIGLKFFEESDLLHSSYKDWFHSQKVTQYNSHGKWPLLKSGIDNLFKQIENRESIVFAIYDLQDNEKHICHHIGNVSLQSIDWMNRSAEFAILIGESDFYKKGVGTIATLMTMIHAFGKCGFNRIWAGTSSHNIGMQKIFEFLGWKKEGVQREAIFQNAEWTDVYSYSFLLNQYTLDYQINIEKSLKDKYGIELFIGEENANK
jgi:ribosomal-protein-alanine N-acetyltransferase